MSLLNLLKKNITLVTVILVTISLVQGIILRRLDYAHVPEPYVILDEHTNVWNGLSLRKTGVPTAWSILAAYKRDAAKFGSSGGIKGFNLEVEGKVPTLLGYKSVKSPITAVFEMDMGKGTQHVPLVQPYLDHPPLGGLILSLGVFKKVSTFSDVTILEMRRSAVYIALITQILIAILAYQLTKKHLVAIIASFAFATAPSFLLLSRYSQIENVLTPFILSSLIVLLFIKEKMKALSNGKITALIALAAVLSGLAALTKISGWISIVLGVYLLWQWKFDMKKILTFLLPATFLGSLFFFWGIYLNSRLFADLFIYQGITRGFIGSINVLIAMTKVGIMNFPFDGWWIGGFLALLLIPKKKELLPFYSAVVLILLSALVLVGANYAWYYIPLIPFMCIAIGIFLTEFLGSPSVFNVILTFLVFVSSSFYWGFGVYFASLAKNNYEQPFMIYRIIFLAFILIAVFLPRLKKKKNFQKIWTVSALVLFAILVLLNHRGMYYIVSHWGKLPALYTPGTFL